MVFTIDTTNKLLYIAEGLTAKEQQIIKKQYNSYTIKHRKTGKSFTIQDHSGIDGNTYFINHMHDDILELRNKVDYLQTMIAELDMRIFDITKEK